MIRLVALAAVAALAVVDGHGNPAVGFPLYRTPLDRPHRQREDDVAKVGLAGGRSRRRVHGQDAADMILGSASDKHDVAEEALFRTTQVVEHTEEEEEEAEAPLFGEE